MVFLTASGLGQAESHLVFEAFKLRSVTGLIVFVTCAFFLASCAVQDPPASAAIQGKSVTVYDNGWQESAMKGQLFYIEAVDGKPVRTSLQATRNATAGFGLSLRMSYRFHELPVKPMKVRLVGTHVTGAPIHEMASRAKGTFFSVEGETSFLPVEGTDYLVIGKLHEEGSYVCIADRKTDTCVTEKVTKFR